MSKVITGKNSDLIPHEQDFTRSPVRYSAIHSDIFTLTTRGSRSSLASCAAVVTGCA